MNTARRAATALSTSILALLGSTILLTFGTSVPGIFHLTAAI
ncbi:hypothetical protein ACFVZ3_30535 [Kitasatospora purpeofusca]